MQIKVGDKIYDGADEAIMVILTDKDKENISNMPSSNNKYCAYPDEMDREQIEEWMEV